MSTVTIKERLTMLEAKVEKIQQQAADKSSDKSDDNIPWWERIVGVFEDNPEFEEVVHYGQKWRASEDDFGAWRHQRLCLEITTAASPGLRDSNNHC